MPEGLRVVVTRCNIKIGVDRSAPRFSRAALMPLAGQRVSRSFQVPIMQSGANASRATHSCPLLDLTEVPYMWPLLSSYMQRRDLSAMMLVRDASSCWAYAFSYRPANAFVHSFCRP